MAINVAIPASASLKGAPATLGPGDSIQKALRQAQQKLASESTGKRPVVFIGSSLIIAPLWSTDVKHGYFYKDCMLHHESKCFENILKKDGLSAPVVSLATAGQFVSDTYLIIDKFFDSTGGAGAKTAAAGAKTAAAANGAAGGSAHNLGDNSGDGSLNGKPLALIYGIAPRDFMDDTTGGLALTSVFDELVEASDLPGLGELFQQF